MAKGKKKKAKAEEPKPKAAAPKPKAASGEKSTRIITKSALRRLMKEKADADLVASSAIEKLMDYLQERASELTKKALEICTNAKRKTVMKEDLSLAIKS
ncbi:MAG: histone-like protein [Candidatus Helarchaeota archaeon]